MLEVCAEPCILKSSSDGKQEHTVCMFCPRTEIFTVAGELFLERCRNCGVVKVENDRVSVCKSGDLCLCRPELFRRDGIHRSAMFNRFKKISYYVDTFVPVLIKKETEARIPDPKTQVHL